MSTPLTILHGGHRKVMRIGANENMSTVMQKACQEFGLDLASPLVLKHKRTVVDLSQPFRFTGIPQNATLELAEDSTGRRGGGGRGVSSAGSSGGQVRVAMRLPGGGRVQASFATDTTLLGLLQWWAERGEMDAGMLQQGPSLQFMRSAYGAETLASTSLRAIGLLTGSAMFTLSLASPVATPPPAPTPGGGGGSGAVAETEPATDDLSPIDKDGEAPPPVALSSASGVGGDVSAAIGLVPENKGDEGREELTEGEGAPSGQGTVASVAAVAPAAAGGMGVTEGQAAAEERNGPILPAMGLDVCRSALKDMEGGHFDADSAACVTTLIKIVDNVVHRKDDARTRQIRCANAAFDLKVGRITGGKLFLEGIGFITKNEGGDSQPVLGGGVGGGAAEIANRVLVLPPDREDMALLKDARLILAQQAEALGVPPGSMPQPPRAPARSSPAVTSHGVAFDPYKPFMTSTAPTPKGSQEQSLTEKRLQELLAKRADVVAGGVPERDIQASVVLPSQAAALAAAVKLEREAGTGNSGYGGGGSGGGRGGGPVDGRVGGDGGLIAQKIARQMAERKKQEDIPFQTKAMREIERLQKATVYRTTIIKVQFPDRAVLQATFASTEDVKDLAKVVRDCLADSCGGREFELYVSPPRTVLKEASSLSDAGLVPAALVYVSWKEVSPAGEAEGAYLKPELTLASSSAAIQTARPAGVALDGGAGGVEESKTGGGGRSGGGNRLGGARGSGSGTGSGSGSGKRTSGKPGWLKIN
eukprot:jgi/Undpi1/2094/HiC_scaffold_12.g05480.m1